MSAHFEPEALPGPLAAKVTAATQLLSEIAREFSPATFANSLGAEDMVLTDLIRQDALAIEIFSLDTGRLPQQTHTLMRDLELRYGFKLKLYCPRHDLIEDYASRYGSNAFYDSVELRRACCRVRKVEPLQRALAGKRAWVTGLRAQQMPGRNGLPLRQFDDANGLEKFNPLAGWSEQEVWAYLRGRGVPYNALHDQHYPSIGCAPCTRPVAAGEELRAGRWWWESAATKECGLHRIPVALRTPAEYPAEQNETGREALTVR
ncbi:thioredoxin-dependent 5'-adenylylsulfate reductase [mine drainage metagenome]|uniref:Adenosine 5'-phosphosulfate reductase n=1 Tax=mine drainage metagenome TaxID=410659 RepID=A0A1J5R1I8_9ZZZZ